MAMIVKNNMSAINTLNTLNKNSSALSKSLQKVSSGMKINSAADDASGYAISERMRVQIRSLDQANSNTQNGSSMMKVAEGAVSSTVDILKTLKEKVINAANDTNTDSDRQTIQKELDQSIDQIDDNANVTFNGKYLVDGSKNTIGKATYTSLSNQNLATDTKASTALTDLKSRSGDSLEITDTDKVTVSYVQAGKTYSTTFAVAETDASGNKKVNTLHDLFVKMEAEDSSSQIFADAKNTSYLKALKNDVNIDTTAADTEVQNQIASIAADQATWKSAFDAVDKTDAALKAATTKNTNALDTLGTANGSNSTGAMKNLYSALEAYNTAKGGTPAVALSAITGSPKTAIDAVIADNAAITTDTSSTDAATKAAATNLTAAIKTAKTAYNAVYDVKGSASTYDATTITAVAGANATANGTQAALTAIQKIVDGTDTLKTDPTVASPAEENLPVLDTTKVPPAGRYTTTGAAAGTYATAVNMRNDLAERKANLTGVALLSSSNVGVGTSGDMVATASGENAITVMANTAGIGGQISGLNISVRDSQGNVKKSANASLDAWEETVRAQNESADNAIALQVGSKANQSIKVGLTDMRSEALGLKGADGTKLNISTQVKANAAVNVLDNALQKALDQQTTIGSVESRLEYTSSNLTTASSNVQSSESTIRDADMAKEMTEYTKNNVLLQAAQSMLSQANQNSSSVLSLLK